MSQGADKDLKLRIGWTREQFSIDVDVSVDLEGITGVFGPSGAGKSTLLRCLAGLDRPDNIEFRLGERIVESTESGVRTAIDERRIATVFQSPRLFRHLDVGGNLDFAYRRRRGRQGARRDDVIDLLDLAPLLDRPTGGLSGGEAQRVAIGRALLSAPELLLMDEPVSALDIERRNEVLPFIEKVHAEFGVPILYVSHNIDEIALLCDQLVVVEAGRVVADGELSDVLLNTDLPVLGGAEASVVVRAELEDYDEAFDITRSSIPGGTLWLTGRHVAGHSGTRVRIRANDVSLATEQPSGSSILNVLDAQVVSIEPESSHSLLVHLDAAGTRILSRITRKSGQHLGISPGMRVFVQIKSISVRRASL